MHRKLALLAAAAVLLQSGCLDYYAYDIRLEPKGDAIERTTVVRHHTGKQPSQSGGGAAKHRLPPAEMEKFTELYSERLTKDTDEAETFRGTFDGKLPADIGGAGNYRRIETPLGSAYWYTERFRGADDPEAELYARRAAADRLADLTVGWFDEQMKDSPHHAGVRKFLHQDFRQDLRNVVLHLWDSYRPQAPAARQEGETRAEPLPIPLARAIAYLNERGYFEPEGAVSIAPFQTDEGVQLGGVRRLLARKSGLPVAEADRIFPFLADPEAVRLALADYLKKTPEYEQLRKSWKPDPSKPEMTEPDPLEVFSLLVKQACDLEFLFDRDQLRLTLLVPTKPYITNGAYDPVARTVAWHADLPTRREMPYVCLAAWAVPDESAQTGMFGKVRLTEADLASFAVLYQGLPAERRKQFADFVAAAKRDEKKRFATEQSPFSEPLDEATREFVGRMAKLLK